jgi:general secretion pathway protein H
MVKREGKGSMPTWIAAICEIWVLGVRDWGLGKTKNRCDTRQKQFRSFPTPNSQHPTPSDGFTLLELTVVLFVIGLLVAVLVPRFGDLSGARLESSARRLATLVRYLNGEAAFRSQLYRLNYDLDRQIYWVTVLTASRDATEFLPDSSPLARPVQLPAHVAFADVRVPNAGRVSTGRVYTHFYPQGYTDPTIIHLRDQRSRIITVMIPPLPAEVRVQEGYVEGFTSR